MTTYENWSAGEHLKAAKGALLMADQLLGNVHASDSEMILATGLASSAAAHAAIADVQLVHARLERLAYPSTVVYGAAGGHGGSGGGGSSGGSGASVVATGAARPLDTGGDLEPADSAESMQEMSRGQGSQGSQPAGVAMTSGKAGELVEMRLADDTPPLPAATRRADRVKQAERPAPGRKPGRR